ncbi:STE-domain-containing protein [Pseudovirgaria hyperparasitica]|uniref:STE-domain-containing protein n=1 Tax=Pseudovirgaria hyperparasitica TaxID=470096 RepID=A0A6A6W0E2_9PEZI|nr:STE-domain-containing protein [Pseudovirgaria hyperparasitica]KAF2755975.1 STE-domain-containing protein [Pseudovirgaria hyperparasitica]
MYSSSHAQMAPPQQRSVAPETFLLDQDAQQSLPPDSIVALQQVDNLKYFLISAPVDWQPDQYIRRFLLPTGEYVSCVLWNNLFHISGTDIVRCLSFRFQAFGRPVKNSKKFEEGIFSDLRNLKSGTDASLEEPKSAFLDFLYKNNCIRTQKKQKVFYWYSVPHDRLFLDALERDLKREKMGQEATTMAVSEPALSFEFDSSQSLFEQLTKAQQTNSSSFNSNNNTSSVQNYSHSTSPVMRAIDSMPPPQMMPQSLPPAVSADDSLNHMAAFNHHHMAMPASSMANPAHTIIKSREREYTPSAGQFDRNGIPISQVHQRHSSMPAYMEYSPAPSFVSSHYDDYSNRGLSFEPITPPQQHMGMGTEPAYIANEETGLYTAIPDMGVSHSFNPLMQLPPSNLSGPQFPSMSRPFPSGNVYNVIEGSPTYKQRRRRSSISASAVAAAAVTATGGGGGAQSHTVHRPSELRRSMSASVAPVPETDESAQNSPQSAAVAQIPNAADYHNNHVNSHKVDVQASRHGTPLATIEGSPVQQPAMLAHEDFGNMTTTTHSDYEPMQHNMARNPAPGGIYRRARSATMMELGPYPQKSHSCPIPTCGRLFRRLEHLKRHVRTHTQERPYVCSLCNKAFSRSDNLAQHRRTHEPRQEGDPLPFDEEDLEGEEEGLGSLEEEESPEPSNDYLHHLSMPAAISDIPGPMGNGMHAPHQLIAAHNY